ncbi:MAG: M48 family metalloprotease [Chromatiaceae bacterium]
MNSLTCVNRFTLALCAGLLVAGAGVRADDPYKLPNFGSSADTVMTRGEERQLGKAFMRSVRKSLPVLDDPLLTDYLEDLGERLVASSESSGGNFTFFFIDQPTVNAFAGPDGQIGVFAGLVTTSETESELAAVLAHEIAHISQRHLMRSIEDQQQIAIPATLLMIAAAILGAQVDANAGMAAIAGIQGLALQRQINFTRHNEEEADRIGISTLADAGYNPFAMPGFFERMSKSSHTSDTSAPEFLRTHPVNPNRIADALARAEHYGYKQKADDLRFHLTRAHLRELSFRDPENAISHFKANLNAGRVRNRTADTYGLALAQLRAGQTQDARHLASELVKEHPHLAEFIVLDTRIDSKLGANDEAIRKLQAAVGLNPDNRPLRIAYAEALIAGGNADRALATLEGATRQRPGSASMYQLMSDAALKSGKKAATYRYRGESLYLQGDLEPAIHQMQYALRTPGIGFHEASEIQARLDTLKEEQKEAEKDNPKSKSKKDER